MKRHNNKILHQNEAAAAPPTCNCQNKAECPLPGRCTIQRVCYQADVERLDTGAVETYTGATMDSFKKRFYGHKSSLNNRDYQHSTTLSTYVWKLKDENIPYKINWNIIGRATPYNTVTNKCRLCLLEKYLIMFKPKGATLNQNSEFFTSCRHKQAHLLGKVKFKKWKLFMYFLNSICVICLINNCPVFWNFWWDQDVCLARNNVVKWTNK